MNFSLHFFSTLIFGALGLLTLEVLFLLYLLVKDWKQKKLW